MMAEHISECPECQQLLAEYERLEQFTDESRDLADDDYWEQSARKIERRLGFAEEQTAVMPITSITPRRKRTGLGWKLIGAAASVAVLAFIGLHQSDILSPVQVPPAGHQPRTAAEQPIEATDEFDYDAVPMADLQEENELEDDVQFEESVEVMAPSRKGFIDIASVKDEAASVQIQKRDQMATIDGVAPSESKVQLPKPVTELKTAASREINDIASGSAGATIVDAAPSPQKEATTPIRVIAEADRVVESVTKPNQAVESILSDVSDSGPREKADRTRSHFLDRGTATAGEQEASPSDTLGLDYWRSRRDSLTSQLNARVEVRSFVAPKKDRQALSQSSPSPDVEEQRLKDQKKYFEAVYMIARLTEDDSEYYRSVDIFRVYLEDFDAPLKDLVRGYLKELEN